MDACRRRYSILMAVLPRARRSTTFAPPPSNPSGHASQSGHPAQCHGLLIRHHYGGLRRGRAVHACASEPRWVADNVHPAPPPARCQGVALERPRPAAVFRASLARGSCCRLISTPGVLFSPTPRAALCFFQLLASPTRPLVVLPESLSNRVCHLHSAIGHPSTAPAVAWPYMHPAA